MTRRARNTRDERGASSVEYGLIAVFIAAVVVSAALVLGNMTDGLMGRPCESVEASGATTARC